MAVIVTVSTVSVISIELHLKSNLNAPFKPWKCSDVPLLALRLEFSFNYSNLGGGISGIPFSKTPFGVELHLAYPMPQETKNRANARRFTEKFSTTVDGRNPGHLPCVKPYENWKKDPYPLAHRISSINPAVSPKQTLAATYGFSL